MANLNERLKGRFVTIEYFDIKELDAAWRTAELATHSAMAQLIHPPRARAASLC